MARRTDRAQTDPRLEMLGVPTGSGADDGDGRTAELRTAHSDLLNQTFIERRDAKEHIPEEGVCKSFAGAENYRGRRLRLNTTTTEAAAAAAAAMAAKIGFIVIIPDDS